MRTFAHLAIAGAFALTPLLAGSVAAAEFTVDIKKFKFEPAELTVAPGDTITFTNHDAAPHTAAAEDGSFDTGRLRRGESATVTVAAGTYAYHCPLHPSMRGTLIAE